MSANPPQVVVVIFFVILLSLAAIASAPFGVKEIMQYQRDNSLTCELWRLRAAVLDKWRLDALMGEIASGPPSSELIKLERDRQKLGCSR